MERKSGILYAIAAYGLWGVLPLFWKQLRAVPAIETLAHRIVWSLVFVSLLLTYGREWGKVKTILRNRKSTAYLVLGSVIIGVNWGVYIWSVGAGHVVDASMGYYINPLVSVLLGVVVLKERLKPLEYLALGMAAFGVVFLGAYYGSLPWIALVLASTFGLYGLFKKMANVDSLAGLFVESFVLAPFFLAYLAVKQIGGTAAFGAAPWRHTVLFMLSGVVTGLPLLWFSWATRLTELSTMGFFFYITPSLSLAIGIFIFGEPFSMAHAVCFAAIWAAIAVYSASKLGVLRKAPPGSRNKEAS
jgi:chloramphenicol-sensitive protein RarD